MKKQTHWNILNNGRRIYVLCRKLISTALLEDETFFVARNVRKYAMYAMKIKRIIKQLSNRFFVSSEIIMILISAISLTDDTKLDNFG